MSSDPTELIREADEALADRDRLVGNMGMLAVSLVRRLRDALRAEQKDCEIIATALDEERAYSAHLRDEVARVKEWQGIGVAVRFSEFREAQRWAEWFAAERDHLRAIRRDDLDYCERTTAALAEARETADRFREGLGETKAALAEANATIQRVKDVLDRSSRLVHLDHFIRRAIEGPQS